MAEGSTGISDHAVIGDGRSAALVSRDGAVRWLCWPRFDSPTIFGALLDPAAGQWTLAPAGPFRAERRYLDDTNVLETRFRAAGGTLVVIDLMPVADEREKRRLLTPEHALLRVARCEEGEVEVEMTFDPRPGYDRWRTRWRDAGKLGVRVEAGNRLLVLRGERPVEIVPGVGARSRFRLRAGETARFALVYALESAAVLPALGAGAEEQLERSVRYWRRWAGRARYHGPRRDLVIRSALALKLLAFAPSGAVVAAPTTSLPEWPGADLNWDYRFCWLRDASFTARALFGLGFDEEATSFVSWVLHTTRLTRPELRVLYDVYGRESRPERELTWRGFRDSRPVRIGNDARGQLQLDVYGEVVDCAAQLACAGAGLDGETRRLLRDLGEFVVRRWNIPDEGIWEPRGGRRHHTHSKVLCWAALDRLLELHDKGHLPGVPVDAYARERRRIQEAVESKGWNPVLASYTQILGGDTVDAALLQLPWYGYVAAGSARMRSTWRRIRQDLDAGGGLLYRYRPPPGVREGAFGVCGFWAAEYLALGGGSAEEAEVLFCRLADRGNDVGLFAEEIDPATGEALGNFPQGFTHLGLINAALTLQDRLEQREQLTHHGHVPRAERAPEPAAERGAAAAREART